MSVGAGILGLGIGALSNWVTNQNNMQINREQMANQHYLLGLQQNWAGKQAEIQDERTRALYNDLQSPEALKEQIKNANLSVGMMYGMNGIGGSMQQGAKADSTGATGISQIPMQPLGMEAGAIMAQMEKTKAEAENIKEDTKKKEAETAGAWKNLDIQTKTLVVMEHQINQIDQQITESKQKCENLLEEKFNTIAERENIKNEAELKKAEKEFTESKKTFQDIQNNIANIQLQYEEQKQQEQIKVLKAQAAQYWAAAKKCNMEADQIKQLTKPLVDKAVSEALMTKYENEKLQPAELKKLQAEKDAILAGRASNAEKQHFYETFGKHSGAIRVLIEDFLPF